MFAVLAGKNAGRPARSIFVRDVDYRCPASRGALPFHDLPVPRTDDLDVQQAYPCVPDNFAPGLCSGNSHRPDFFPDGALPDPGNADLPALIGQYVSYDVRFEIGLARDIQDAIKEFYDEDVAAESHAPDDLDWEEDHRLIKEEERLEQDEVEKDRPVE